MASRRFLKKQVNSVFELAADMCLIAEADDKDNKEAIRELFNKIVDLRNDIISRISHTEPGNVKAFYKKLHEDLTQGTHEIISKLYELEA